MESIQKEVFTQEQLEKIRENWADKLQPLKEFMTVDELAEYLGLSKSAIYKITGKKEIPHYNPGGKKIYFKRTEVNTWIESGRIASDNEVLGNSIYNSNHEVKW